jgi:hypothetical protein
MIIALLAVTTLAVWTAHPDDVSMLRTRRQLAVDELHAQWSAAAPDARAELNATLDRVCAQKDCHASRLFWHTDLEQAKAEAQRLGRPILSLHLLGRLDEELSCANSRFFRTLLYSDESISALLREQFVLHWQSVREVPRVTIELGDGRVLRQTITGNSAHYLLDANGAPLDVLPGLYSAAAFRDQLERWVTLHRTLTPETLLAYHGERQRLMRVRAAQLGIESGGGYSTQPVAWAAQRQAQSKAATEVRVLRQVKRGERTIARQMEQLSTIGEQGKAEVQFSESTLRLMRTKQELTEQVLDNLRRTIAADTVFNEYELHRRVHEWFVDGEVTDLASLNERVYDELFLTPSSDPWLGLQPDSVFTGIEQLKPPMTRGAS